MGAINYVLFSNCNNASGYKPAFISNGGAETAGTVANAYTNPSNMGGETAGSVASSSTGGSTSTSSCGCSFSAIA